MFIPRTINHSLQQLRSKYPILAITGPRQSGKTTLLLKAFPDFEYVSLENPDLRERAESDPNSFLERYDHKVIFDEVQRVPQLFSYLQTKVDLKNEMGMYILSGSQNFLLLENITQSLAGRVALLKLLPFSFKELDEENLLSKTWQEAVFKGFYPPIFDRQLQPSIFYPNYLETYIERDLRHLIAIKDLRIFRLFLKRLAAYAGQLLNLHALAADVGISSPTAKAWLSVLESSYIVFMLHPFYRNFKKRLIKSPKLYFYDTGLICHLLDMNDPIDVDRYFQRGSLFENLIIAELYKSVFHQGKRTSFYFWRDSNRNEVDLIWETAGKINLIEIKSGKTFNKNWIKNLTKLSNLLGDEVNQLQLIYGGDEAFNFQNVEIIGWKLQ